MFLPNATMTSGAPTAPPQPSLLPPPPPQRLSRLKREVELLAQDPPFGVSCWPDTDRADLLHAQLMGLAGTPYDRGLFRLEVVVPERYPFEPPAVRFLTPIYHPNIDTAGRICLDVLKMPPKGSWKPALNIGTVLTSVQQLMAEPNPDDALMSDVAAEFSFRQADFDRKAREATLRHAVDLLDASLLPDPLTNLPVSSASSISSASSSSSAASVSGKRPLDVSTHDKENNEGDKGSAPPTCAAKTGPSASTTPTSGPLSLSLKGKRRLL